MNTIDRSVLENWYNGNYSELSKSELIRLVRYFETGKVQEINEDLEY